MNLLDLPVEVRKHILSYLLHADRARVHVQHGRRRHDLDLVVLRANRQIYEEGISVLRENRFVKLLCSGPAEFAPGVGFPAAGVNATRVKRATVAIAEIDVNVRTPSAEEHRCDYHLITLKTMILYFEHLASRQITTFPSTTLGYREATPDEDAWWVRYDVAVAILWPPGPSDYLQAQTRDYQQDKKNEREVYIGLRGLRHVDNTFTVAHRVLPHEASETIAYLRGEPLANSEWFARVQNITTIRKTRLDALYLTHGAELVASGGEMLFAFRDLCLDLQFFLESCELTRSELAEEALGPFREPILTLLFSAFYSYILLYYHHRCTHLDIWPFQQRCAIARCVCLALGQTDASIHAAEPSSDARVPLGLWYHMQHLAAVIHGLEDRNGGDLDLEELHLLLKDLQRRVSASIGEDDKYLTHDIAEVQDALLLGLRAESGSREEDLDEPWWILWCRLSIAYLRPRLLDSTGQVQAH